EGVGVGELGLLHQPVLDHARCLLLAAGAIEQQGEGMPAIRVLCRALDALEIVLLGFDRLAEAIAAMAEVVEDSRIFGLKLQSEREALAGALVVALLGEVDAVLVVVPDALLGGGFAAHEPGDEQYRPKPVLTAEGA